MILNHQVDGPPGAPAVLLLHAGACDLRMWDAQWPALTATHRVVRCDLRGYGASPLPPGSYSDADDVLALLDHLEIGEFGVVGSSYGGYVALQVASARSATRLVLLCSAYDLPSTDSVRRFAETEAALLEAGDLDGAAKLGVETWLGPDADGGARERLHRMQKHAFEVQLAAEGVDKREWESGIDLKAVTAPAHVVSGAHDLDHFQLIAVHLTGELQDATHSALPWAGHLPSLERPAEMTDLLLAALR